MKIFIKLVIVLVLISTSCSNKKAEIEPVGKSEIKLLGSDYHRQYFWISNFVDNENNIKYIFEFANNQNGDFFITTNENGVKFEDNYAIIDTAYQRLFFVNIDANKSNNYEILRANYKQKTNTNFIDKKETKKTILFANIKELNINILQNMLDYAEKDKNRKKNESFTYELYNKDNIKKVVIIYHNYGEWFSIDIL